MSTTRKPEEKSSQSEKETVVKAIKELHKERIAQMTQSFNKGMETIEISSKVKENEAAYKLFQTFKQFSLFEVPHDLRAFKAEIASFVDAYFKPGTPDSALKDAIVNDIIVVITAKHADSFISEFGAKQAPETQPAPAPADSSSSLKPQ